MNNKPRLCMSERPKQKTVGLMPCQKVRLKKLQMEEQSKANNEKNSNKNIYKSAHSEYKNANDWSTSLRGTTTTKSLTKKRQLHTLPDSTSQAVNNKIMKKSPNTYSESEKIIQLNSQPQPFENNKECEIEPQLVNHFNFQIEPIQVQMEEIKQKENIQEENEKNENSNSKDDERINDIFVPSIIRYRAIKKWEKENKKKWIGLDQNERENAVLGILNLR